jgi:rhodanese-related sulfurtransferase
MSLSPLKPAPGLARKVHKSSSLPLSELKGGTTVEKLKEKLGDAKVLYLHCGSGKRCLTAADLLKKQGYDGRPLKEGFSDLVKAGFEKAK